MKISQKNKLLLSVFTLGMLVACGSELPIQNLNTAKREIGRAESLRAGEFAPEELSEAKKSLYQAHEKAADENGTEARKLADYATSKAYDALERSLPRLSARAREEATQAIDAADEAFATGFAPGEFDRAVALRKEGDFRMERGDESLNAFLQERSEEKKSVLRKKAFQEYEASYNHYLESKKVAEGARATALSSKGELRQSARYVEEDLNTAETYLGGPNDKTRSVREVLASAYQDIERGELKKANEKIEQSRSQARTILAGSIQNYARERLQTATEVVEDSNSRFEKIAESDVQSDPALKDQYERARENLGAANEALASAGNLYSQEKYEDSIQQSEEAIRLSEIVMDQTSSLSSEAIARARRTSESPKQQVREPKPDTASSKKLSEGWSKYTVRKTKPEDCLWRIAGRKDIYGNPKLWPRIYRANKSQIRNRDLIFPNQVLYIPPKSGEIGSPYTDEKDSSHLPSRRLNLKDEKDAVRPAKTRRVESEDSREIEEEEFSEGEETSEEDSGMEE